MSAVRQYGRLYYRQLGFLFSEVNFIAEAVKLSRARHIIGHLGYDLPSQSLTDWYKTPNNQTQHKNPNNRARKLLTCMQTKQNETIEPGAFYKKAG